MLPFTLFRSLSMLSETTQLTAVILVMARLRLCGRASREQALRISAERASLDRQLISFEVFQFGAIRNVLSKSTV